MHCGDQRHAGLCLGQRPCTSRRLGWSHMTAFYIALYLPGVGSIQFQNWNCSLISIPISELELELELKLMELKMELELKTLELELELKPGIDFFCNCYCRQDLLVNQPLPNFSFNSRGYNLSCEWLLMQHVCLEVLGTFFRLLIRALP